MLKMAKVLQVVIYTAISDEAKLAAYAKLAGPAMQAAGGVFLARGVPVAVAEDGQMTRTVVVEWASLEAAMGLRANLDILRRSSAVSL
jgi:uncharacterized protein (DUF1330 family)